MISEINTIPGFTPISLFPTMPASRRLRLRGRLPAGRRPRARAACGPRPPPAHRRRPAALTMVGRKPSSRKPIGSAVRAPKPSALRPGARPGGGVRRTKPVKRASAGILTPVRAGAALALLVAAGGLYGAMASDAFVARTTTVSGNTWTSEDAIRAALAVPDGQNVFTLGDRRPRAADRADPGRRGRRGQRRAAGRGARSPSRSGRRCSPGRSATRRFLVDARRHAVRRAGRRPARGRRAAAARRRPAAPTSVYLGVGDTLDPVTLDAALRLGSLAPADVGSGGDARRGPDRRRERLRAPRRARRLERHLRLLHADAADDRAHPGPGPAAPEPAARERRGGRPAGDPRRRGQRDVDPAPDADDPSDSPEP